MLRPMRLFTQPPPPLPPLLPPPVRGWPVVLRAGGAGVATAASRAALVRVRAERLWWPAPRAGAPRPRACAFSDAGVAAARAFFTDAEIAAVTDPGAADPERLEAVFAAPPGVALWARIGGVACDAAPLETEAAAAALLAGATARCPWRGRMIGLDAAVEAQSLLRAAAIRARGPVRLAGMSPWKRACLRPFLTGPDGAPRRARGGGRSEAAAVGPLVVWGADGDPADLRVEDGFLRSVGLGIRHAPPVSLILKPGRLHFDARGPNSFETLALTADVTPALRARAARLRARVLALRLTKYNLGGGGVLPDGGGRMRLLVPGQVESDASIRFGAGAARTNAALVRAARARFPDAFLLYKPHPDVISGWRPGAVDAPAIGADAVACDADAGACLDWADRVATITSLMGFEALLRGKPVTTFGHPFYAGWGLTDDVSAPPRGRALDLDALTAAALILYPDYVDPVTALPAPPEIVIEALARERAEAHRPRARLRAAWRAAASWVLLRL